MPKRREDSDMNNRVMVKASASEQYISFRTISRERKSSREFCFLRSELLQLKKQSFVSVTPINSPASW